MKKKKINFDDLIDRLIICIEKRNPNTILDQTQIDLLKSKWRYKEKQLYSMVKTLEQNETKVKDLVNKYETHEVEFKIGVSLSGEDIIVKHIVKRLNQFKKTPGRFVKKQKGDFQVNSKAFISKTIF